MYNYNNPGTNQDCVCLRKNWGLQSKPRLVCLQKKNGAPGANQDNVCLLWESGGTCRLMMQSISLCDHVSERASRGVCQLLIQNSKFIIK